MKLQRTTGLLFLMGMLSVWPVFAENFLENITPQESAKLIKAQKTNHDFKILDVRTPAEFVAGHLKGATLLDFYSASFVEDLKKLDKHKTYLIYCHSGARSGQTLKVMNVLGFKKIYHMPAGFRGWHGENLPVEP